MNPLHCVLSLLFLLCCLCPMRIEAQQPYHYQISDEQGLPSNEVYDLVQDSFGYIWLGCDAGLFRYDGFRFKQYKNAQQNGRSISGLRLDRKGRVWCKNFNGQVYCAQGDSLHIVFNQTDYYKGTFALDAQDRMWTVFQGAFQCYDHQGQRQKHLPLPDGDTQVSVLSLERYGDYLYAAEQGERLMALDLKKDSIFDLPRFSDWHLEDSKIFVPTPQGLGLLVRSTRTTRHRFYWWKNGRWRLAHVFQASAQNNRLYRFCPTHNGQIWLGTNNGAFVYRMDFDSLHQPKPLLPGKKVSSIFMDREGQYWLTTLQHGIFVVPNLSVLRYDQALDDPNLTALAVGPDRNIWLGGHTGGLQRLDLGRQQLQSVALPKEISLLTVKDIEFDEQGHVWVSHGGLSEFVQGRFKQQHALYNARAMAWVGDSLFYVLPSLHGLLAAADLPKLSQPSFLRQDRPKGGRTLLYQAQEQALYWILADGLYRYHRGQWTELRWNDKPIYANDLACYGRKLAVATVGQGLLWIEEGRVVGQWNASNSPLEAELRTVALNERHVWVVGHQQLYRLALDGQEPPRRYGFFQGINAKDINQILLFEGQVYLATNKGLFVLPQDLSAHNAALPRLRLLAWSLGEQEYTDSLPPHLHLPHNHGQLGLVLSSVALRSRGRYEHWYRLQGLDSTWNRIPASQARLVYPSIPPGQYRFEAKAVNESGVESPLLSLEIRVAQPYWQQWWFYALVSLLTAVVVSVLAARRIRAIEERAALENQLTASQLTALKAQMNPHFMYNALNSIQALLLQQDVRNSTRYLSKFSTLMRKVLDASGRDWISLADELEILELYLELEKLRFGQDLQVSIQLAEGLDPQSQQLPSMILQPFVENALKHGLLHKKGIKTLELSFELDDKFLYCVITDNGIGRQRAQEIKERQQERHHSFATQAAEKRMALLNQYHHKRYSIEVEDLQGAQAEVLGTRVKVIIPLEEV